MYTAHALNNYNLYETILIKSLIKINSTANSTIWWLLLLIQIIVIIIIMIIIIVKYIMIHFIMLFYIHAHTLRPFMLEWSMAYQQLCLSGNRVWSDISCDWLATHVGSRPERFRSWEKLSHVKEPEHSLYLQRKTVIHNLSPFTVHLVGIPDKVRQWFCSILSSFPA